MFVKFIQYGGIGITYKPPLELTVNIMLIFYAKLKMTLLVDVDRLLLIIVLLIVNPSLDFWCCWCLFLWFFIYMIKVALNSYGIRIVKTD